MTALRLLPRDEELSTPATSMFTKKGVHPHKLSYVCFLSFFILLLMAISSTSPELGRRSVSPRPSHEFVDLKAHDGGRPRRRLDFLREEFGWKRINVGLVNVDDEGEIREWEEVGETQVVRFDRVANEISWNAFFPEWIDENEKRSAPKCPEIPMPRFEDYEGLDVVVVRVPSGRDQRDVFRLQVNLVAANLVVRSGRRVKDSVVTVFAGSGSPMLEIFRCDDLVTTVGDLRVYRPNLGRLEQKMALPLGSCQLSLHLIKHGKLNSLLSLGFSIEN